MKGRVVTIELFFDKPHVSLEDIRDKLKEVANNEDYLELSVISLKSVDIEEEV